MAVCPLVLSLWLWLASALCGLFSRASPCLQQGAVFDASLFFLAGGKGGQMLCFSFVTGVAVCPLVSSLWLWLASALCVLFSGAFPCLQHLLPLA